GDAPLRLVLAPPPAGRLERAVDRDPAGDPALGVGLEVPEHGGLPGPPRAFEDDDVGLARAVDVVVDLRELPLPPEEHGQVTDGLAAEDVGARTERVPRLERDLADALDLVGRLGPLEEGLLVEADRSDLDREGVAPRLEGGEGDGVRDFLASGECGEDLLYVRDAHLATGGEGDRDLSLPAQARLFGGEPNPEAPQGERAGVPDVELGVCALGHGE